MRKLILILSLTSTSFCGLGDEYRAYMHPEYERHHSTKENLTDFAAGYVSIAILTALVCYFSPSVPTLNFSGFLIICIGLMCSMVTDAFG